MDAMKTLNIVVVKAVSVIADSDEEFEKQRRSISRDIVMEELRLRSHCNNQVEVFTDYDKLPEIAEIVKRER